MYAGSISARRLPAGDKILGFGQTGRLDQSLVVRRIPRREQGRCVVEVFDQQADLVVDGEAGRPAHFFQALLTEPLLGSGKQSPGHGRVIDALEEPEKADAVIVHLEVAVEPDGSDTPDRLAVGVSGKIQLGI